MRSRRDDNEPTATPRKVADDDRRPGELFAADGASEEVEQLRYLVEHAPEASLVLLDRDYRFVYVNATYAGSARMSKHELIGRDHFELFPNEENRAIFDVARETGEPVEYKAKPFVYENDPGRGVTYWDWTLTPILGRDGKVRWFVMSVIDVTERTVARQLAEAASQLDVVLHSSLDLDEILRQVIEGAVVASGCETAAVALRTDGGWTVYVVEEPGGPLDELHFADDDMPVAMMALETRQPGIVVDVEAEEDVRDALGVLGLRSVLNVPLIAQGEVIGVLGLNHRSAPVVFDEAVVQFAERIAASLAFAIANARIVAAERRRRELEGVLNRTLGAFGSAREPVAVLREACEDSVAGCGADYSMISMIEGREWVTRWAFGEGGVERLRERYEYEERPALVEAAESLRVRLVEDAMADPGTNKEIMRRFEIGSFAIIPLVMGGQLIGMLELVWTGRAVRFGPELVEFFDRLMGAVAVALERTQEQEKERHVAEMLQGALLALPEHIAGLELSHAYHSAVEAARVGGDFYDVFELDDGLVGLTIGDISGKGLDAAALTSLVRHSIRARAVEDKGRPSGAVGLADRLLLMDSGSEVFATVFFGLLDRGDGRLVYCSAGHPAAAIVRRDGDVVPLPATSPVVGAMEGMAFADAEAEIGDDDVLLLYTDGLIEARHPGGEQFGEDRLFESLSRLRTEGESDFLEGVLLDALAFADGRLRDDVALLQIRRTSP